MMAALPLTRTRVNAPPAGRTGAQEHLFADIEAGAPVNLRRFPARPTPFEAFQQMFGVTADSAEALAQLNALMELPEVRAAIEARGMAERGNELRAPQPAPR